MNNENLNIRSEIIKNAFYDNRNITEEISEEERNLPADIYQGGDLYKTEDGELIDLELQINDFDVDELVKYVELAEELYYAYDAPVSIYILCSKNVRILTKECEIMSEANFTIRLASPQEDIAEYLLEEIKDKLKKEKYLSEKDLNTVKMLPIICDRENRNYFRKEHFKIINKFT